MFGKKHSPISKQKMSKSQKIRFAESGGYWLGKKRSDETKKKLSESQMGRIISQETIEKRRIKMIGHKVSQETRNKISKSQKGKPRPQTAGNKNAAWKGGISPLVKIIRASLPYEKWRGLVFKRDNYKCIKCGDDKGGNLIAHHIDTFSNIFEKNHINDINQAYDCKEFWDVGNGSTLCDLCHEEHHKINWKNQYGKQI